MSAEIPPHGQGRRDVIAIARPCPPSVSAEVWHVALQLAAYRHGGAPTERDVEDARWVVDLDHAVQHGVRVDLTGLTDDEILAHLGDGT